MSSFLLNNTYLSSINIDLISSDAIISYLNLKHIYC